MGSSGREPAGGTPPHAESCATSTAAMTSMMATDAVLKSVKPYLVALIAYIVARKSGRPKRTVARHPVDRVYSVLGRGGSTDDYVEKIRGR